MKRFLLIISATLAFVNAFAQTDTSSRYARLDSLLVKFYATLELDDNDSKVREFNYLISSCRDSLTRQHVALGIIDHYSNRNRIMGEEIVALRLYDEWIASGKVKTRDEFEQMNLELFASFNRSSMVGMQAPVVELRKPCGRKMSIPEQGRVCLLFFYDTSCAKCRLEAKVLPGVLEKTEFPLNVYAVDTGTDRKAWRSFRKDLKVKNRMVHVEHLWDPEIDSDYQRKYGVTGTPRMFVILEDGEILGRKLEVDNLSQIFHYIAIGYGTQKEK